MAALLEKMDQQNEKLQLLAWQQAEWVDVIALKQKETDGHIDAIKGDLDSVKGIMDGRMSAMEESIAGLKSFHAEIGEQQKSLKQELLRNCCRNSLLRSALEVLNFGPWRLRLCHQTLLLVWFREKEREEEILRALEMLLEVELTALTSTETRLTVCGEEKPFQ